MKSVRENTGRRGAGASERSRREAREPAAEEATPAEPTPAPQDAPPETEKAWSYEVAHPDTDQDLAPVVGKNLRRLRSQRGLSLERLAKASGVSRAMLGQIELGQSAPTINVLWKIARALDVTFATLIQAREAGGTTLLKKSQAKVLTSHGGLFSSRALFPFDGPRRAEFYELRLAARATEAADAHAPGTVENLVVVDGVLEIVIDRRSGDRAQGSAETENHRLETGDAIVFEADVPHAYVNLGDRECIMYLV